MKYQRHDHRLLDEGARRPRRLKDFYDVAGLHRVNVTAESTACGVLSFFAKECFAEGVVDSNSQD